MSLVKSYMCGKESAPNETCLDYGENMNDKDAIKLCNDSLCPELLADLSIGKQIPNWNRDAEIVGMFKNNYLDDVIMPDGEVKVLLYQSGIKICGKFYSTLLQLHNLQIESINEIAQNELENRSAVDRAVLGNVLFGELDEVLKHMSENKKNEVKGYYLIINYWDVLSREIASISIGCDSSSKRFIERFYKQKISKRQE